MAYKGHRDKQSWINCLKKFEPEWISQSKNLCRVVDGLRHFAIREILERFMMNIEMIITVIRKETEGRLSNNGLDARLIAVEPDQDQNDKDSDKIGDVHCVKKSVLQDFDWQQQAERSAKWLRDQEEQGAGFERDIIKPKFQIGINGNQF